MPEGPVDLDSHLGRRLDEVVHHRGVEAEDLAGGGGQGIGIPLVGGEEADLAEQLARVHHAEVEGAVGGGALEVDLPPLQHVEVASLAAVGEDQVADVVNLLAHRLG